MGEEAETMCARRGARGSSRASKSEPRGENAHGSANAETEGRRVATRRASKRKRQAAQSGQDEYGETTRREASLERKLPKRPAPARSEGPSSFLGFEDLKKLLIDATPAEVAEHVPVLVVLMGMFVEAESYCQDCTFPELSGRRVRFPGAALLVTTTPNIAQPGSENSLKKTLGKLMEARALCTALTNMIVKGEDNNEHSLAIQTWYQLLQPYAEKEKQRAVKPAIFLRELFTCILEKKNTFTELDDRLETMVDMSFRFIMRKIFNRPPPRADQSETEEPLDDRPVKLDVVEMGSYEYNYDDPAAIICDALAIRFSTRASAEAFTAGSRKREVKKAAEAFVTAHTFLRNIFIEMPEVVPNITGQKDLMCFFQQCVVAAEAIQSSIIAPFIAITRPVLLVESLQDEQTLVSTILSTLAPVSTRPTRAARQPKPDSGPAIKFSFALPKLELALGPDICPMCKQPVLDSDACNAGGEICCDVCETWFHLNCLQLPPDHADKVDTFRCHSCEANAVP